MKKLFTFLSFVIAAAMLFAFAACGESGNNPQGSGDVTTLDDAVVFTVKSDFIKLGDTTSVKDYLDALQKNGELTYAGKTGEYGFFIQSVNGKAAEGNGFWGVYTDLVTLEGDGFVYSTTEWGSYEYAGKTLGSASVGVSALPCVSGYTYALVYTTY